MKAIFNFSDATCTLDGNVVSNADKTISVVATNGTCTAREVLTTYEQYGESCLKYLSGVCAFCVWDSNTKTLFSARDRMGEKSLYYAQLPTQLIISSDLHDIIPYLAYPAVNILNLAQPIRYNFPIDLQQTWIEQIKRVRAGECLLVNENGIRSRIYWKRRHTSSFMGTKVEAQQHALQLLRKSVKKCVETAQGPVAILLSGGIDSTSLAALTKEIQQEVHVFCAGYSGNNYTACDERAEARRFAEEKGLIFHEIELQQKDYEQALKEYSAIIDEPCFDVSCTAQYLLYKHVAEMGFKVILSGLGGDELFYSYAGHHKEAQALALRHEFYQLYPIRKNFKKYLRFVVRNYKYMLLPNYPARIDESMLTDWTYNDYKSFADDAILNGIPMADIDVQTQFQEKVTVQDMYDYLGATFAVNMCVYLGNKLCNANGIELRCPFLAPELVEFLDALPMEMKFDVNQPKRFQKEMMAGIIPNYILYARKRGFEPPFEFIRPIAESYKYKHFSATHCFYNSMMADLLVENQLFKAMA